MVSELYYVRADSCPILQLTVVIGKDAGGADIAVHAESRRRRRSGAAPWCRSRSSKFLVSTNAPSLPSAPSMVPGRM